MKVYPKFMDHKIKILDCTLRDGGYYNNWNFSLNLSQKYLQSITKLPIDIIEVGYISNNKNDNFGLHYHLNVSYLKNIKKKWLSHNRSLNKWPRTQDLDKIYYLNNAAFITKREVYIKLKDRIGKNPLLFENSYVSYEVFDIDDKKDFNYFTKNLIRRI